MQNQAQHRKARLAQASTLNLKVLNGLPEELKRAVCKNLGIEINKIPKSTSWPDRQILAKLINAQLDKTNKEDLTPKPSET